MPKRVVKTLDNYLKVRKNADDKALITTSHGRISKNVVQRLVKKYAEKAGLSNLHSHSFRHGSATYLLQNDINIMAIKDFLGHKAITTTQQYTHVTDHMMNDIRNALDL